MFSIQFKRGTASQNDTLVEPSGVLTIDTDNRVIRLHDGTTPGGHSLFLEGELSPLQDQIDALAINDVDGLSTALASKALISQINTTDGPVPLNANAKIAPEHLMSFVEDVIEVADQASLPATGETGKLYVTRDTNQLFRWKPVTSEWVEVAVEINNTDDLNEGTVQLYFTAQRVRNALSSDEEVVYDSQTGEFSFNQSVDSVNNREGAVTFTASDLDLGNVQDYPLATPGQAEAMTASDAYITPQLTRTSANRVGIFEDDGTAGFWFVEGGELETPTGPGPKDLIAGDLNLGYYGPLPQTSLFTEPELSALLGIENLGVALNTDFVWLKFSYKERTLFIPSKPLRRSVSWQDLYLEGLVFGTNLDEFHPNGFGVNQNRYVYLADEGRFKVRLPYGRSGDETSDYVNTGADFDPVVTHDSEWNELLYRITDAVNTTDPSAPAGVWDSFTAGDLQLTGGAGSASLSANVNEDGHVVYRGFNYVDRTTTIDFESRSNILGWRPVLEHFTKNKQVFDIFDIYHKTEILNGFIGSAQVVDSVEAITVQSVSLSTEPVNESTYDTLNVVYEPTQTQGDSEGIQPIQGLSLQSNELGPVPFSGDATVTESVFPINSTLRSVSIEPVIRTHSGGQTDLFEPKDLDSASTDDVFQPLSINLETVDKTLNGFIGSAQTVERVDRITTTLNSLSIEPVRQTHSGGQTTLSEPTDLTKETVAGDPVPVIGITTRPTDVSLPGFIGDATVSELNV